MAAKKKKTRVSRSRTQDDFSFDNWEELSGAEFHKLRRAAYRTYCETLSPADCNKYLKAWAKLVNVKPTVTDVSPIVGALCRLRVEGCPAYNEKENDYWKSLPGTTGDLRSIDEDIRVRVVKDVPKPKKEKEKPKKVVSVRDRMIEQLDTLISNMEGTIDDWLDGLVKFKDIDFYKMMISYEVPIKPAHVKIIRDHFDRMIEESRELVNGSDKQLTEGYSHLTSTKKKELLKIYESIESACEMIARKGKATRKPRKPKEVSKDKIVARVKYKKVDTTYDIASLNPVDILGASEVWVFNTKTRKLGQYIADEYEGPLSIKGTTITGFDKHRSVMKTLRKPNEQLKEFSKAGKVKLRKFMASINTKESELTGRLNKDVVILKVQK